MFEWECVGIIAALDDKPCRLFVDCFKKEEETQKCDGNDDYTTNNMCINYIDTLDCQQINSAESVGGKTSNRWDQSGFGKKG